MEIREQTDWEAEADMRTLSEAEKIKNDPGRVARAKQYARRKSVEYAKLAGETGDDVAEIARKGYRKLS
jgi:hypothetical protein